MDINMTQKVAGYDIYGLAYNCPYLQRIDGCPFKPVDSLSFKKKVDWIRGLNVEEKANILDHHSFCTRKRDTNQF